MVYEQANITKTIDEILHLATDRGYFFISGSSLTINLHKIPIRFYRHGWQSWSLTTWLDPADPVIPISAQMTRVKDEDIPYSLCNHPVGAWIGAIEMDEKKILLIGAMELSGRVEITGDQIRGFYEDGHDGKWLVVVGSERVVFECYKDKLGQEFGIKTWQAPKCLVFLV